MDATGRRTRTLVSFLPASGTGLGVPRPVAPGWRTIWLMPETLLEIVTAARDRADVLLSVDAIYRDLEREIATRKPRCVASGKCCRFEAYGHRLYVTTMELAAFAATVQPAAGSWDGTGCPYQVDGLCSVHPIRPFGCRIFFCDPTATQWQNDHYEIFHNRFKSEHERLGIPYRYVEWRFALNELQLTPDLLEVSTLISSFDNSTRSAVHLPLTRLATEGFAQKTLSADIKTP
jgi:Fe-S-cluster containining protein